MERGRFFKGVTFFSCFFMSGFIAEEFGYGYNIGVIFARLIGDKVDVNVIAVLLGGVFSLIFLLAVLKIDDFIYAPPTPKTGVVKKTMVKLPKGGEQPMFMSSLEVKSRNQSDDYQINSNGYTERNDYVPE